MRLRKLHNSLRKRWRKLRCVLQGGKKILFIGDSHLGVFEYIFDHQLLTPHFINCDVVGGATAYGVLNNHSITKSFVRFTHALQRFQHSDLVVIMLGEVDCCYLLWKKANGKPESAMALLPKCMEGIQRVINKTNELIPNAEIVLAGAVLPTIKDEQYLSQESVMRREITATQRERTELVLAFNAELHALAKSNECHYLDITAATLDQNTGLLNDDFLLDELIDHHQSQAKTANLWVRELRQLIRQIGE